MTRLKDSFSTFAFFGLLLILVTLICVFHFRIDSEALDLWKKLHEKEASRAQSIGDPDKVTEKTSTIEVFTL